MARTSTVSRPAPRRRATRRARVVPPVVDWDTDPYLRTHRLLVLVRSLAAGRGSWGPALPVLIAEADALGAAVAQEPGCSEEGARTMTKALGEVRALLRILAVDAASGRRPVAALAAGLPDDPGEALVRLLDARSVARNASGLFTQVFWGTPERLRPGYQAR